jgi:hypothetical protein
MMFLFAYLGNLSCSPGWPLHLIYGTEAAFVLVALVCVVLAIVMKGVGTQSKRDLVAFIGGTSASFGLIMPFELAPFFFNAPGEIMLGTIVLIGVYPIAGILFVVLFRKYMSGKHVA